MPDRDRERFRIRSQATLRRVVRALVRHYGDGSENLAAVNMGIPQPTLWRAIHEPRGFLLAETRKRLLGATEALGDIAPILRADLEQCLIAHQSTSKAKRDIRRIIAKLTKLQDAVAIYSLRKDVNAEWTRDVQGHLGEASKRAIKALIAEGL